MCKDCDIGDDDPCDCPCSFEQFTEYMDELDAPYGGTPVDCGYECRKCEHDKKP